MYDMDDESKKMLSFLGFEIFSSTHRNKASQEGSQTSHSDAAMRQ